VNFWRGVKSQEVAKLFAQKLRCNSETIREKSQNVTRYLHTVYRSISMTLTDLKPDFEVKAFFKVEYLGPDWCYVRWHQVGHYRSYSTSNRPIWSITRVARICQLSMFCCIFIGLVKIPYTSPIPMACATRSDFLTSLYIKNSNSQSIHYPWTYKFRFFSLFSSAGLVSWLNFILFLTFAVGTKYQKYRRRYRYRFSLRDADMHSAYTCYGLRRHGWVAGWLSVTRRTYCIKTAKHILKLSTIW